MNSEQKHHVVIVEKGWSYVVGPGGSKNIDGPYRYQWEAQECADERNAALRRDQQCGDSA